MAHPLGVAGMADHTGAPLARYVRGRRAAESPAGDFDVAHLSRTNTLVVGPDASVSDLLCSRWSTFEEPVMRRRSGERLRLPPSSEPVGTLLLEAVDTLTDYEQRALQDWLIVRNRATRVVSTTAASLLDMVDAGTFNDSLYYRLNVVRIDLDAQRQRRSRGPAIAQQH